MPSEAFSRYAELLRKLHELIAQERTDSEEADALRDEMEGPWAALSPEEQRLARGLSHDLYSLSGAEPVLRVEPRQQQQVFTEFERALASSDWRTALSLLRQCHSHPGLKPEVVASVRARCWQRLGYEQPAAWFSELAAALRSSSYLPAQQVLEPSEC